MFKELDRVALTVDLPEEGLQAGDVGMVLHVYPQDGYEVEFVTLSGKLLALLALAGAQIRALAGDEIAHARPIQRAL